MDSTDRFESILIFNWVHLFAMTDHFALLGDDQIQYVLLLYHGILLSGKQCPFPESQITYGHGDVPV